ncbi:dual specificity protein phosphatase 22 isoform X2 [Hydra vulgaris]|uniref:Dual specificity protein phosphatase 15 n=1 Tax=Hydra vulgaris TaxID=6087 RepID=T2M4S5_HYDVU
MGNGMNKVLPGLFIGNFRDAKDMEQITGNNITHILAVHDNAKPSLETIEYKCVDITDNPGEDISKHFKDCVEFIHEARKKNGNVLVHCIAGVSRSSTICAAYLITITNLEWDEAILAVRVARQVVNPNCGFQKQLQTYQQMEAIKVRDGLEQKYGQLDQSDVQYIKNALDNCQNEERVDDILHTTPTFASYARKKR